VAHLKELSKETFETEGLCKNGLVLIDFWAPWCAPCRALLPILEELATHYQDRVTIAKMNVDHDPQRAVGMGVRGVPTVIFLKDGQEIDRVVGAICRSAFMARIDGHLGNANGKLAEPLSD
jgi:thioredoxin 1